MAETTERLARPLESVYWLLRVTFGIVPIVAGLDKFFNLLTRWEQYLNPALPRALHVAPTTLMHIVGIIEIVAGVLVLIPQTSRYFAYVVSAWLLCIAIQLLAMGSFLDIAVRDVVMCFGAWTLARLSEVRGGEIAVRRVRVHTQEPSPA
jgi:uncharacterized membrane protein YphA (DoxX/SURF4 family)